MEHIRRKPMVSMAIAALILALFAASRHTGGPRGPICVEASAAQPGFVALSTGPGPACIRIRLD